MTCWLPSANSARLAPSASLADLYVYYTYHMYVSASAPSNQPRHFLYVAEGFLGRVYHIALKSSFGYVHFFMHVPETCRFGGSWFERQSQMINRVCTYQGTCHMTCWIVGLTTAGGFQDTFHLKRWGFWWHSLEESYDREERSMP